MSRETDNQMASTVRSRMGDYSVPGFDYALGEIAKKLEPSVQPDDSLYSRFKRLNDDMPPQEL